MARIRFLTNKERKELSIRILKNGDPEARNTLVARNMPLVVPIANCFLGQTAADFEDLIQEGYLGLIRAAEKYDYRKGRFSTYATWWIRQSIQRAISDRWEPVRVPVQRNERLRKVKKVTAVFQNKFGRDPTYKELAKILRSSVEEITKAVLEYKTVPTHLTLLSLDFQSDPGGDSSNENGGLLESVPDKSVLEPEQFSQAKEELRLAHNNLQKIFDYLNGFGVSQRNIRIFKMRYGLDGSFKQKNLERVGKSFGVTRERVRQITKNILLKLGFFGVKDDGSFFEKEIERIKALERLIGTETI